MVESVRFPEATYFQISWRISRGSLLSTPYSDDMSEVILRIPFFDVDVDGSSSLLGKEVVSNMRKRRKRTRVTGDCRCNLY